MNNEAIDVKGLLERMAGMDDGQRRMFFENKILPALKFISPLERDQVAAKAHELLKPLGIMMSTIKKMVNDELKPPTKNKKPTPSSGVKIRHYNRSDVGNARRFVDTYGDLFRYCHKLKAWFNFDGRRWLADNCGLAQKSIHAMAMTMQGEAGNIPDPDERVQAFKWAVGLESVNRIENCLKAAQSYLPIEPTDFDRDPWLLNCENGTVDLRTGELRAHDRENRISKLCPVEYDPGAKAPLWDAFLQRIFDEDQDLINYVQKMAGYSLTGVQREKEFYLCWGTGDNGKSKFVETIQGMLGDYASTMSPETLTVTRDEGGASPELARLVGVRFVSSQETERGRTLREGFIKAITGGDTVTARFLYGQPFDFRPVFKLWFSTNFKPEIKAGGEAMWRRVKLIPFNVTIPLEEQDKELFEKLKAEWPGILAWAVQGCLEWQREGHIEMPGAMKQAVDVYKAEMDTFEQFIEACCEIKPVAQVANKRLRAVYEKWCQTNGERPLRQNEFSGRLVERGLQNSRASTSGGLIWYGLGVIDEVN